MYSLRPMCQILRGGQKGKRGWICGQGNPERDQFHARNRIQGLLGLQRMLPPLPHRGAAGRIRADEIARFFPALPRTYVRKIVNEIMLFRAERSRSLRISNKTSA